MNNPINIKNLKNSNDKIMREESDYFFLKGKPFLEIPINSLEKEKNKIRNL
jgi:hypothetical protein